MKEIFAKGMLFDFYGELLTPHQRQVYSDAVFNDMTLSELSEEYGVSRQSIHDLIKRCDKQLDEYEMKLGLVSKFNKVKENVTKMDEILEEISKEDLSEKNIELCDRLQRLHESILEEL